MNQYLVGLTVLANTNLPNQEVLEQVRKLIGLGIDAASELAREFVDEKKSAELTALAELGIDVIKVNNQAFEYSPNTLYVLGTDTKGALVVRGSRSSLDAVKDSAIMHAALELSQAVELRDVSFPERRVGALLVRPAGHTSTQLLLQKAMASLAQVGDIYTDAAEGRGAVKTAQNLGILANLLSADNAIICHGMLRGDGDEVAEVDIRADGSFLVVVADLKESARWSVETLGKEYPVTFFAGECSDDETWVVGDAHAFYADYLNSLTV